jgi:hypothetical protein
MFSGFLVELVIPTCYTIAASAHTILISNGVKPSPPPRPDQSVAPRAVPQNPNASSSRSRSDSPFGVDDVRMGNVYLWHTQDYNCENRVARLRQLEGVLLFMRAGSDNRI